MRTGLSTIQQTLAPEAATVLNQSIAEASRRSHGQTTPLHVAATLLSSPVGYLRQACIKSHPNSSHPLQCRALELCFSVALERLPTAQNSSPGLDPPISNALMAALKRAQAHQRRGCPEQQQQPLLAVKVELEQLIISILDDPSVSRVMREASFSSPAVKASIEQSISSGSGSGSGNTSVSGFGFRAVGLVTVPVPVPVPGAGRNLYMNPKLQRGGVGGGSGSGVGVGVQGKQREEEVKKVLDILMRSKKRNPFLVGELEPELVVKEVLRRVENKELGGDDHGVLKDVRVVHLEKEFFDMGLMNGGRIGELVERKVGELGGGSGCGGVILDLGDLKWLVEQPGFGGPGVGGVNEAEREVQREAWREAGRVAVTEMGKVLERFGEGGGGGGGRVWLIGNATCETYLRCHVYHPTMENDWDLQIEPIAARNPVPGTFPRIASNGLLGSSMENLPPLKGLSTLVAGAPTPRRLSDKLDPVQRMNCCPQCNQSYEHELAKITAKESDKTSADSLQEVGQPPLPQWLRNVKSQDGDVRALDQMMNKDQEQIRKQKTLELQKKWHDTCVRQHPHYHQSNVGSERTAQPALSMPIIRNLNTLPCQPLVPRIQLDRNFGGALHLNHTLLPSQSPVRAITPPQSPVETDLVLWRPKVNETTSEEGNGDRTKDFLGLAPPKEQIKLHELPVNKLLGSLDADSFKKLVKGLVEKVSWQREAATAVATTVTQCKLGNGKRRGGGSKGDIWLIFSGPDKFGKKKMASALSDMVCEANPVVVSLGSRKDDGESELSYRGKTALDQIVDAVRRNPSSVIMLEDIDKADMLVRGSIKRAIERGRLADSHGREISLGNVIFILTTNWLPDNLRFLADGVSLDETKLAKMASGGWQLRLSLSRKTAKRRANWLEAEYRITKPKKDLGSTLSFDLNEAANAEDDKADGSYNSSDLTIEHGDEPVLNNNRLRMPATSSVSCEMLNYVDDNIVFKPIDFGPIRLNITNSITKMFTSMIGDTMPIEIQEAALEKILGGVCLGQMGLEEWTEKVLVPSIHQLNLNLRAAASELMVIRLELDVDSNSWRPGDTLPSSIRVVADGL